MPTDQEPTQAGGKDGRVVDWRCSCCGEPYDGTDGTWRWTGTAPGHKCPGNDPQAGYFDARYFGPAAPSAPSERTPSGSVSDDYMARIRDAVSRDKRADFTDNWDAAGVVEDLLDHNATLRDENAKLLGDIARLKCDAHTEVEQWRDRVRRRDTGMADLKDENVRLLSLLREVELLMGDQSRNLNPHKSARAAMWLHGKRYAAQRGGSMDFWDMLSESDKHTARRCVKEIEGARREGGQRT